MQERSIADQIAKGRQEFNDADQALQAGHAPVVPPNKAARTINANDASIEPPMSGLSPKGESEKPIRMTEQETKLAGQKLFNQRHFAEAIPLLKLATEAFPKDVTLWRDLTLATSLAKRHDEAVECAIQGTKHHPSDGWLWRQLGEDLLALDRLDEAEAALNKGLIVDPDAPWLWRYFARLYRKRGKYSEEAAALEQLVSLGKANGDDLNLLGIAYKSHGNFSKAIECYGHSFATSPSTAPLFNMALVFSNPELSQDVDATDAYRRALLLNPNYEKAKEQLEALKRKLISLGSRAREAANGMLQPDEWFQFYVSPFEALNLRDVEDSDSLDPKAVQRAKREMLSEIELDGSVSWLDGYPLDKARAIALVDELDDPTKRYYHFAIFQNKPLLRFLTRGEIEHFLYSDDYFPQETLELLEDDEDFGHFISKAFAQQFDLLLSRGIDRFELDVVEALFDGRRWVTAANQEACFQRAEKWVADLLEGIHKKRIASEAKKSKLTATELADWLSRHGITTIFNLLPSHFRPRQNELVAEIRLLAVSWYNQHNDVEMARDVLAVCKQFRFKSEELNQRLEKDRKKLGREIAEEQFVKKVTTLVDTVRLKRGATAKRRGPPGLEQAAELLRENGVEELFSRIPAEFRNEQTQLAAFTRSIAIDCFNKHCDPELSRAVLNLCKRFQFEDAELTDALEKDFKTIDEIIAASSLVERRPVAASKANDGAGSLGCLLLIVVIGVIIYAVNSSSNKTSAPSTLAPKLSDQPNRRAPAFPTRPDLPASTFESLDQHLTPQRLPQSGETRSYVTSEGIAPFEIRSSSGTNYLVKLVDAYSGQTALTVFVRGGSPVQVKVPLGDYVVKYAAGQTWYGYDDLFGSQTAYSKAETTFLFRRERTREGYSINGYTITLYRVSNGNLSTQSIRKDEF